MLLGGGWKWRICFLYKASCSRFCTRAQASHIGLLRQQKPVQAHLGVWRNLSTETSRKSWRKWSCPPHGVIWESSQDKINCCHGKSRTAGPVPALTTDGNKILPKKPTKTQRWVAAFRISIIEIICSLLGVMVLSRGFQANVNHIGPLHRNKQ